MSSQLSDRFVPTPVATESGHARTFEATYEWVAAKVRSVPITRVFDVTPLDYLGLPVWSAVTPCARDLTVHAGKGETPLAARLSAIMEAIERTSAELLLPDRMCLASYEELVASAPEFVLDPVDCDLPYRSTYHPRRRISWVLGFDLLTNEQIWVAADLVISPAREGVCSGVETNGLAAGNTHTEATVHALYEIIERDAAAHADLCEMLAPGGHAPHTTIDPSTVTGRPRRWIERLRSLGLEIVIRDLAHDTGVPVFDVRLLDPAFPSGAAEFGGYGASLNRSRALFRAISEAVQAHTMQTVGSRDEYEPILSGPAVARGAASGMPPAVRAWSAAEIPGIVDTDLLVELHELLDRIRRRGCGHCVVADLTQPALQVPVVRVLADGFAHPYGFTQRRPPHRLLSRLF